MRRALTLARSASSSEFRTPARRRRLTRSPKTASVSSPLPPGHVPMAVFGPLGRSKANRLSYRARWLPARPALVGGDCDLGESCCGGACVELDLDENHCGACGVECPDGQECVSGNCRVPLGGCPPGVIRAQPADRSPAAAARAASVCKTPKASRFVGSNCRVVRCAAGAKAPPTAYRFLGRGSAPAMTAVRAD